MTNGEKFKEVFGFQIDKSACPFPRCSEGCGREPNWSCSENWWNAKYKEPSTKFQEKIANAKPTTWLTDGLTDEEVKQIVDDAKAQAKRDCENCKHRIQTVDIFKGNSIYGCELWECKFEPKEVEE